MPDENDPLWEDVWKHFEAMRRIKNLEERLGELEKGKAEETEKKERFKGIEGYRFTPEEIGEEMGIKPDRLSELAQSGFAPCRISDAGDIYFRHTDIKRWIKENLYTDIDGQKLPVKLFVYSGELREEPLPKELAGNENICEYVEINIPTCVYFLIKDNKIVYVGQSVYLPARLGEHKKHKDYDRVLYLPVPQSDLNRVEQEFIKAIDPVLNRPKNRREKE